MSTFLHRALLLDAAATGATALLLMGGAGLLAGPLGLPAPLLRGAGMVLVPFVALIAWAWLRPAPPRRVVWAIIGINAVWVLGSFALLFGDQAAPTALGTIFVIAQAVAVGAFAELQFIGLRRGRAAA